MRRRSQPDDGAVGVLLGTAAAVGLLYVFRTILWPFAFALVIAIMVQAFNRPILRLWPWANRGLVMLLTATAALGLMFAAAAVAVSGATELLGEAPLLQRRLDGLLVAGSEQIGLDEPVTLASLIGGVDARVVTAVGLRSLRGTTSGLVLTGLFVIFLLATWELIERRMRLAIGAAGQWQAQVFERSVRGVESYLWIQTITGVMNGVAAGLIMYAVGLEHWAFWSLALFLLNYIPFLGVAVGSIGPALFAMLQFPAAAPSLIIFFGIQAVAFVVGNLITPKMQADNQNIDPCAGLIAVGAWTIIWGLPGAFLSIPLTLALMYQLSGSRRLRWLAILLSNDGDPLPKVRGTRPLASSRPRTRVPLRD